jgi:hypothetical protein
VPTVTPITNVTYTLSLITDPITGPFTSTFNTSAGIPLVFRLNQVTAGPLSNVTVSFGDGNSAQNIILSASVPSANISYNYSIGGAFTISASPSITGAPNATITVNTISTFVRGPPFYTGLLTLINGINRNTSKNI